VSARLCLACHEPVARRIALRVGVHREVTTDCVACHVEHAGLDGELRPFDESRFDHTKDTGFPLTGQHTGVSCAGCHTTRSFLEATSACVSCHADPHTPTLGSNCETCHATEARFAESAARFDHRATAFPLAGAHASTACAACHENKVYRGLAFGACSDCHDDPHAKPMGAACASCHSPASWRSNRVDHARTAFPLLGRHEQVVCTKCHSQPALRARVAADTCASCHADPHAGEFNEDCASCHTESGFEDGTFDHLTTRFPLVDAHAPLSCTACHADAAPATGVAASAAAPSSSRVLASASVSRDFRGLGTACVSCHADVHRGELGATCEQCHSARTFEVTAYTHAADRPFFAGEHRPVACDACHVPGTPLEVTAGLPAAEAAARRAGAAVVTALASRVGFTSTATACASCHRDVHLGQVGDQCQSCHAIDRADFTVVGFSHERTRFPLTGAHAPLLCGACHKVETAGFPAGTGRTTRLTGIGTACASCHADPHAGQLAADCGSCHGVETFEISQYTHTNQRALRAFFTGRHLRADCSACHQPVLLNPSSALVASYRTPTTCVSCHDDVHRGALGPDCLSCHRP
jgi:hypothetical protein